MIYNDLQSAIVKAVNKLISMNENAIYGVMLYLKSH